MRIKAVVVAAGLLVSGVAQAGPTASDLAKCMAASTSQNDRTVLMKWMFAAVSTNPTLAPLSRVTPKQRSDSSAATGALFTKLLTESCKDEARKAVADEGAMALQESFQALGQLAAAEMFSNPDVIQAINSLEKNLDKAKLSELRPQ